MCNCYRPVARRLALVQLWDGNFLLAQYGWAENRSTHHFIIGAIKFLLNFRLLYLFSSSIDYFCVALFLDRVRGSLIFLRSSQFLDLLPTFYSATFTPSPERCVTKSSGCLPGFILPNLATSKTPKTIIRCLIMFNKLLCFSCFGGEKKSEKICRSLEVKEAIIGNSNAQIMNDIDNAGLSYRPCGVARSWHVRYCTR